MNNVSQGGQRDWFHLLLKIILGGIFIYAAVPKIYAPQVFFLDVLGYHITGTALAKIIAIWVPWIELISGIGIILNLWYPASLRIVQGLLTLFIIVMIITLIRGITTDCGCFGTAGGQVSWWHVIGDVVLLLVATFLSSWTNFHENITENTAEESGSSHE